MPRLPLFFARRYLFSRKSHSVINIISGVSAFSVAVPVIAMVVLLSVFNGFEGLIKTMYRSFDPDLAIMPARGQVFATDSVPRDELLRIDGVREVSYSLDGNALLEYRGHQFFGMIRGVDSLYAEVVPVDSMTVEGQYRLRFGDMPEAFVGQGVAPGSAVRSPFTYRAGDECRRCCRTAFTGSNRFFLRACSRSRPRSTESTCSSRSISRNGCSTIPAGPRQRPSASRKEPPPPG